MLQHESECLRCVTRRLARQVQRSNGSPAQRPSNRPFVASFQTKTCPKRYQHSISSRSLRHSSVPDQGRTSDSRKPKLPRRQLHHYATVAGSPTAAAPKLARLSHRRLLVVHGQDAAHFLQGLTTNNVPTTWASSSRDGFYSAFLNAQGRLLNDVFIYPASASRLYQNFLLPERIKNKKGQDDPGFVIEADADGIETLAKHLKRYKLRAKVDIWLLDPAQATLFGAFGSSMIVPREEDALRSHDNRAPGFGTRVIVAPESEQEKRILEQRSLAPLAEYHRARHIVGISEGQAGTGGEMPYGACLPHETNVDLMGGIDFRKGCYVGQELTIRTQHKGVVRKRMMPVSLFATSGTPIKGLINTVQDWSDSGAAVDIVPKGRRGRPAGRWVAGIRNDALEAGVVRTEVGAKEQIGLAMCRLEMLTDLVVEVGGDGGGVRFKEGDEFVLRPKWEDGRKEDESNIGIKAHVPLWIRNGIESRTKRGGQDRAADSDGNLAEAVG